MRTKLNITIFVTLLTLFFSHCDSVFSQDKPEPIAKPGWFATDTERIVYEVKMSQEDMKTWGNDWKEIVDEINGLFKEGDQLVSENQRGQAKIKYNEALKIYHDSLKNIKKKPKETIIDSPVGTTLTPDNTRVKFVLTDKIQVQWEIFRRAVEKVNLFDFFLDSEEVLQAGGTELSKAYKQLIDLLPEGKKDKIAVLEFAGELIGKKDTGKLSTTDKHFLAIHHLLKKHGNTKAFYDYLLDLSNICNGEKDLTNDKIRVAGLPYYKRVETAGGIVFIPTATKIRIDNKSDAPFLVPEHLEGNVAVGGKSRMKTIREITTAKTNTEKNQLYNDFVKNGLVSDGQEFYVHVDGVKIELQLTLFEKNDLIKAKQRLGISQNELPQPNIATDSVVPPTGQPDLAEATRTELHAKIKTHTDVLQTKNNTVLSSWLPEEKAKAVNELIRSGLTAEKQNDGTYLFKFKSGSRKINFDVKEDEKNVLSNIAEYIAKGEPVPVVSDAVQKSMQRGDKTVDAYLDELKKNNVSAEQVKGGGYRYYYTHSQSNQKVEITSALTDAQKTDLAGVVKYMTTDISPAKYNELLKLVHTSNREVAAILFGNYNEETKKEVLLQLHRHLFGSKALVDNGYKFHKDFESIVAIMKAERSNLMSCGESVSELIYSFHKNLTGQQPYLNYGGKPNPYYQLTRQITLSNNMRTLLNN